jgi:hypothetical protein
MKTFNQYIAETKIKTAKMLEVEPRYGRTQARGGKSGGPTVFGVDHKDTTVWFHRRKDAKAFIDWKGRKAWDGNSDLEMSMVKDGIDIKPTVSGH